MALQTDLLFHRFQGVDTDNCGSVCLEMIYAMQGIKRPLSDIRKRFKIPPKGKSTYSPQLGLDLVEQGLKVHMTGMNTQIIPPAWNDLSKQKMILNQKAWIQKHKKHTWVKHNTHLVKFLESGGTFTLKMFGVSEIKAALGRGSVILICIDEVWLYGNRIKKHGITIDNIGAITYGHFVLIVGYEKDMFQIADPLPLHGTKKPFVYLQPAENILAAIYSWGGVMLEVSK